MTQQDRNELYEKIFSDENPGVKGMLTILCSIWRIENVDWTATKEELSLCEEGRDTIKQMEKLPLFKEILVKGGYDIHVRPLPREEQNKIFEAWEGLERKTLRACEEPWLKEYQKRN